MIKKYINTCTRCGTKRIVSKTWKEKMYGSTIINTQTICPNPECQKKVDTENKKQRDKQIAMNLKRVTRKRSQKK